MNHEPDLPARDAADDTDSTIRELRIRVGLLQSELDHLRREHATLKANVAQDIAMLTRRYLEPQKHGAVRHVDGVIFGGWDRPEAGDSIGVPSPESDRDSKSA